MQGRVTVDAARRLIRCEFDEDATVEDWREATPLVLRLSAETGIRRVLVDLRQQQAVEQMADLFEFGASIPSTVAFAGLTAPNRADHRFVETVARSRKKNVRLFVTSEEDAIAWLMTCPDEGIDRSAK